MPAASSILEEFLFEQIRQGGERGGGIRARGVDFHLDVPKRHEVFDRRRLFAHDRTGEFHAIHAEGDELCGAGSGARGPDLPGMDVLGVPQAHLNEADLERARRKILDRSARFAGAHNQQPLDRVRAGHEDDIAGARRGIDERRYGYSS